MNQDTEKTRYSDSELEEFRELIEGKLQKAREQLNFYVLQMEERGNSGDAKIKGLDLKEIENIIYRNYMKITM